jgi:hypothetical protein
MPPPNYFLSEADRAKVAALMASDLRQVRNTAGRPAVPEQDPTAPEVYVARTPALGIAALSEISDDETGAGGIGTGTGTSAEAQSRPGYADCDIYRLTDLHTVTPYLTAVTSLNRRVYNLYAEAIDGNAWVTIKRDKFGQWWVDATLAAAGVDTGTGTGTDGGGEPDGTLDDLVFSGARVFRTDPIPLAGTTDVTSPGTFGYIEWQGAEFDTDDYWSVAAPQYLFAPADGWYVVGANTRYENLPAVGADRQNVGGGIQVFNAAGVQQGYLSANFAASTKVDYRDECHTHIVYLEQGGRVRTSYQSWCRDDVDIPASDGRSCEFWIARLDGRDTNNLRTARVRAASSGQTLTDDEEVAVEFDTVRHDRGGLFDAPSAFVAPAGGYYLIGGGAGVEATDGAVGLSIKKNGAEYLGSSMSDTGALDDTRVNVTALARLEKGDRVELFLWTKGVDGDLLAVQHYTPEFWVVKLSAPESCCTGGLSAYSANRSFIPAADADFQAFLDAAAAGTHVASTPDVTATTFAIQEDGFYLISGMAWARQNETDLVIEVDDGDAPFALVGHSSRSEIGGRVMANNLAGSILHVNTLARLEAGWSVSLKLANAIGTPRTDFCALQYARLDGGYEAGGGGTDDHAALDNLAWTDSGHTGTADKYAGFDGGGNAAYLDVGVTDHAALASNLAWSSSGHTGTADTAAGFDGGGAAVEYAFPWPAPQGGTGFASFGAGDLLVGNGSSTLDKLPVGGDGTVIQAVGGLPAYSTIAAMLEYFGGTDGMMIVRLSGAWTVLAPGSEGDVLTIVSGVPAWQAP